MVNSWLPPWLGLTLAAVFAVILIVHLYHVLVLTGRARLWHCVHVVMATGMIVMFAPTGRVVVWNVAGGVVFAAAAVTLAAALVRERGRGRRIGMLWLVATIDLAAMVYMFAMVDLRLLWLTVALAAWFVVQATGWTTGRLYAALAHGGLGSPAPDHSVSDATPPTPTESAGMQAQCIPPSLARRQLTPCRHPRHADRDECGNGLYAHCHAIRERINARHAGHVAASRLQVAGASRGRGRSVHRPIGQALVAPVRQGWRGPVPGVTPVAISW